jgi:hypothetical protein
MTAPATIRPLKTSAPSVPALVDAEILAANLVWTLWQIQEHTELKGWPAMELFEALDAAKDAQHRITSLQLRERHS